MRAVAARCFHNGIRQPVASKADAVPKSFATSRSLGVAPRSQPPTANMETVLKRFRPLLWRRAQAHIPRSGSLVLLRRFAKPRAISPRRAEYMRQGQFFGAWT